MAAAGRRIVFIGLGGASCAGKTTLANLLLQILPEGSFAVHQDDFGMPASTFPIHSFHGIADWDDAPTALDWPRLRRYLYGIRDTGSFSLPYDHKVHEHAAAPTMIPVDEDMIASLTRELQASPAMKHAIYVIVDGFVAFWDKEINDLYSMRLFIREEKTLLKHRRETQRGFVGLYRGEDLLLLGTDAVPDWYAPTEHGTWENPPGYFDKIVWPAYSRAHAAFFQDGDVERGDLSDFAKREDLVLMEASQSGINEMLEVAARAVLQQAGSGLPETGAK